ncbi:hypothetical protein BGZ46_009238 [Entomortierella lignicola]|nr:hypothetical protein BGZ46_009238 [Entomortierella lignicola]
MQARYNLKNKRGYLETKILVEAIDRLRFLPLDKDREAKSPQLSKREADLQQQIVAHVDRILCILETRRLNIAINKTPPRHNEGGFNFRDQHGSIKSTSTSVMGVLANQNLGADKGLDCSDHKLDLDLDDFTIAQLQPHLDVLKGLAGPMTEAIQKTIQQRAQDIVEIFNSGKYSSPSLDDVQQTIQFTSLPDVVLDVRKQFVLLDRTKEEIVLKANIIQSRSEDLFETLHKSTVVLWEILVEFMVRYQLSEDLTFKEYFTQMIESVVLKLEILRISLQESVYDKDTVAQLTNVRETLDQKQQALISQTEHNSSLLSQYQSAGKEFNMIVDAYADIMQRIEVVQDDIRRLR